MSKMEDFMMYEFLREPIEDYLKSHQFDNWKWNNPKQWLQVYKFGRKWIMPYYEFTYSDMSLDEIFSVYVVDNRFGKTIIDNYELHQIKDCDYVTETYIDETHTSGQTIMYEYGNVQMRLYLLSTIRDGLRLRRRRYFKKGEEIDEQIFEERFS